MRYDAIQIHRMHTRLPIFRLDRKDHSILYTPGQLAVIDTLDADDIEAAWQSTKTMVRQSIAAQAANWISTHAKRSLEKHRRLQNQAYRPVCLTVYLSNYCNMHCTYCFADYNRSAIGKHSGKVHPVIDADTVVAAAEIVVESCYNSRKPFQLVIHGGGEPSLHWSLIKAIISRTQQIAQRRQVEWRGHIATNGMLSENQAVWLGQNFHSISLSCDGPPEIQDHQRPLGTGQKSSEILARTAAAIHKTDTQLTIRATITPTTCTRQTEIVEYLHHHLGARRIRFEPAYQLDKRACEQFVDEQALSFVEHFIKAQHKAIEHGSELNYSGLRLNELHGPYCNVLRQVLQLTPDGLASACFLCTVASAHRNRKMVIGQKDNCVERFCLDQEKIANHLQSTSRPPTACQQCINQMHCTYGCPDYCTALIKSHQQAAPNSSCIILENLFRCRVNRRLAEQWICRAADQMIRSQTASNEGEFPSVHSQADPIERYLTRIPPQIDASTISRNYFAVKDIYNIRARKMPDPIWVQRSFEHNGKEAWHFLNTHCEAASEQDPISIYIHIPFCQGRCGFCDCLAIGLKKKHHNLEKTFTDALINEMEQWSNLPGLVNRPVTTVHFGGGTPNCIRAALLKKIVHYLGQDFNCNHTTQWAVETTVRKLSEQDLNQLKALGFLRLHIGVQSLNNIERQKIGRKHDCREVLQRIKYAIGLGFITSVDIIYGLPGQTIESLIQTLEQLTKIGIHGISLYRLNRSRRNARFFKRLPGFQPDALENYIMLQSADQHLIRCGYSKNHFSHYALPRDDNLYANHAHRGEDLLALGPTSDGIMGPYHYRHLGLANYNRHTKRDFPPLEGGLCKTINEQRSAPLYAALLSAQVDKQLFQTIGAESLLSRWIQLGLVEKEAKNKNYTLSANGSWLVREMLEEVSNLVCPMSITTQ